MSTTCNVTFTARGPMGDVLPFARLQFVPEGPGIHAAGAWTVPRDAREVTADGAGQGAIGLVGGRYVVSMTSSLGVQSAPITVPADGTKDLWELLEAAGGDLPPASVVLAQAAAISAAASAAVLAGFATGEPFSGVTVAGVADYPLPYNPMAAAFVRLHVGGVPQEPGAGFTLVAMPGEPSGWGFRLTFPVIDEIEFWGFVQRPIAAEATDPTFRFPDGVVSAPGFAFAADLDTGIRRRGTNELAVVTGGADRLVVNAGGAVLTGLLSGTAVTQTPVDATAGRVLRVGDFGIGISGDAQDAALRIPDAAVDLPSGFFSGPGPSGVNYPTSGAKFNPFINLNRKSGTANFVQTRVFFSNNIPIIGNKLIGGSWAYATAFTTDNLVGPVSQAAGVPTGAVIERGSNANGEFTRWADGTMICTRSIAASSGVATTWTFPSPFAAAPHVTGTAIATVLSAVCLDAAPTTTAATFSARDKADARRADTCHLIARGRWF